MRKKLLFFITSLAGGGAEKVLVNMVNHMDKEKYDITVLTLFDYGVNRKFLSNEIKYRYVFKRLIRGNTLWLKLFSPSFLYKRMIKENYDIVVSYFQSPTTRIVAGCTNENTKLVQWVHNEFHDRNVIVACYKNASECVALQKTFDANVYVANTVKNIYLQIFPEVKSQRNEVLYNIVESDVIRKKATESVANESLYKNQFTLISVGRMVPQKAFDRLIRIVGKLVEDGFDIKLLLLGSGELEDKHKALTSNLKIDKNVEFLGYQENPYKYVEKADLFVCSSLHEGFSTAVTEALIVGTPVITTMCSGMSELLGDSEYGVIVDNDEGALYDGIRKLLENPELLKEMKTKSVERGRLFEISETIGRIESFIDSL